VQELAVAMLESMDRRQQQEAEDRQLRVMLVASGKLDPSDAFPEYFTADEEPAGASADDVVYDYSQVDWESPGEAGGIEEFERMTRALAEFNTLSIREDPEPVTPTVPASSLMEPDDGEWI
jgi:hypothetical protein